MNGLVVNIIIFIIAIFFLLILLITLILYTFHESLINYDLKRVKTHNKQMFQAQLQRQKDYYKNRSIFYNLEGKKYLSSENKTYKKSFKNLYVQQKDTLNKQKISYLPATKLYLFFSIILFIFCTFFNNIILINLSFLLDQEGYTVFLIIILLIVFQSYILKINKFVN